MIPAPTQPHPEACGLKTLLSFQIMKNLIIFAFFLGGSTATFAQTQPLAPKATETLTTVQQAPVVTAADSVRERARQQNALQLRRQASASPKLTPTTSPTLQRHMASGEALDAAELENRTRVRNQQSQEMISATLAPKRVRKDAAKAAAPAATTNSENDKSRRNK